MAGEYIFKNPILKEIHLSYMRMNATLDGLFSIFNAFISNKLSNSEKEKIMENKDNLDFSLKNIKITLDEVKQEYEYSDPVLNQDFTEFSHPVMDNEGFVREKYQYNVDKSIHSPKKSVTIIESSDLRKIQKDHKTIEKRFDDMSRMFVIMMAKMDDQSRQIAEQTKRIDELLLESKGQRKTIEEQRETIAGLKEDIALVSKQAQYQFEVTQDKLNIQSGIIANQEKMLNSQAIKIESMGKFIETLNETDTFKQFYRNKMKLHPDQRQKLAFDDKNEIEADFENLPLVDDKWLGCGFNPLTGFRDTFSIFTPSSVLKTQKLENELRKMAFDGDLKRMESFIERHKSIINGRGMPDSICSRTREFFDKTALMLAAKQGHLECVKFLIANGAEINFLDRDNFTALDYAQQNFHKSTADYLKRHYGVNGADVLSVVKEKEINEMVDRFELTEKNSLPSTRSCPF